MVTTAMVDPFLVWLRSYSTCRFFLHPSDFQPSTPRGDHVNGLGGKPRVVSCSPWENSVPAYAFKLSPYTHALFEFTM